MTTPTATHPRAHDTYRFYAMLMAAFVTVLVASNFVGPAKACRLDLPFSLPIVGDQLNFGAGNIFFPLSYIFGDVLTEVYGYARARKVIWAGFISLVFVTFMSWVIIHLPLNPDEGYNEVYQPALEVMFGNSYRIVLGSIAAYWLGDFANSYVMAKMKVWTAGKHLWTRTIGSTIVGQGIDSVVFYPIAFYGIWESRTLLQIVAFNFGFKVAIEALFTPITYLVVGWLKRVEDEDVFDHDTNFTPFSLED
jgi:uncharacterized integral membrane protein (TIGR00697 family)